MHSPSTSIPFTSIPSTSIPPPTTPTTELPPKQHPPLPFDTHVNSEPALSHSKENIPPENENIPLEQKVSVLYVKRKRNEPANPASLYVEFSAKRQKTVTEFKFVTCTPSESAKLTREELYKHFKRDDRIPEIKERCRRDAAEARKTSKYSLLSSLRTEEGAVLSATTHVEDQEEDDIMCNAERMGRMSLGDACAPFVSDGAHEYVYDVYLCEETCEGSADAIHKCEPELEFEPTVQERFINEYDEDSNDENYFGNDYPDEEESGNSGSENEVVRNLRCSNDFFDLNDLGIERSDYLDRYLVSDTDSDDS